MTAPDPRLEEIEGRLAAVSPGPWEPSQGANADGKKLALTGAEKAAFLALSVNDNESPLWLVVSPEVIPAATGDGPKAKANAEFIAAAPADIAYLLAELRKAQDALSDLLYVADHKAADTQVGRWWAEVIRGPIIQHLGDDGAARLRAAVADTTGGES